MTSTPAAELSALASSLDDLTGRIGALATAIDCEPTDRAAIDLYEAERSLIAAARRMSRARQQLESTNR